MRPNLTLYQHKLNKGRGLLHTADAATKLQGTRISVGSSGSKRNMEMLTTNYESDNNNNITSHNDFDSTLGSGKRQFFTNFMHTQETIPRIKPADEFIPDESEIREQYRFKLPVKSFFYKLKERKKKYSSLFLEELFLKTDSKISNFFF